MSIVEIGGRRVEIRNVWQRTEKLSLTGRWDLTTREGDRWFVAAVRVMKATPGVRSVCISAIEGDLLRTLRAGESYYWADSAKFGDFPSKLPRTDVGLQIAIDGDDDCDKDRPAAIVEIDLWISR